MSDATILQHLALARRIADHADRLGVHRAPSVSRVAMTHLGAALADAILQAGVNYRTVVYMRVQRIQSQFPETATLPGLMKLVERNDVRNLLAWNHSTKVTRFISLTQFLASRRIETTCDLKRWLSIAPSRKELLRLNGIGPKTCDYLCCLVGIDCIAIDRHVRLFASEAGVVVRDYEMLRSVVSFAADLLNIARRDFDAWIWRNTSGRTIGAEELWPSETWLATPARAAEPDMTSL